MQSKTDAQKAASTAQNYKLKNKLQSTTELAIDLVRRVWQYIFTMGRDCNGGDILCDTCHSVGVLSAL